MKLGHPESVRLASNHIQLMTVNYSMEHRAGIEPANTGFADQRVSHFATGAHLIASGAALPINAAPEDYLLCGKVFSCQVPAFHLQPCSPAIGAFACVFHRRRRRNDH
jgi:hypothetical protein